MKNQLERQDFVQKTQGNVDWRIKIVNSPPYFVGKFTVRTHARPDSAFFVAVTTLYNNIPHVKPRFNTNSGILLHPRCQNSC